MLTSSSAKTETLFWSWIECYLRLLPVPLSMLTVSVSLCEDDSFNDWPMAKVTNIVTDSLQQPFCRFWSKHSCNAQWFSQPLCMRVTVSVNHCPAITNIRTDICGRLLSSTSQFKLMSGDKLAINAISQCLLWLYDNIFSKHWSSYFKHWSNKYLFCLWMYFFFCK